MRLALLIKSYIHIYMHLIQTLIEAYPHCCMRILGWKTPSAAMKHPRRPFPAEVGKRQDRLYQNDHVSDVLRDGNHGNGELCAAYGCSVPCPQLARERE